MPNEATIEEKYEKIRLEMVALTRGMNGLKNQITLNTMLIRNLQSSYDRLDKKRRKLASKLP